jgi:HlyD family secretion protein
VETNQLIKKLLLPHNRGIVIAFSVASIMAIFTGVYFFNSIETVRNKQRTLTNIQPVISTVNALGRLEPKGEVIKISASSNAGSGSKIAQMLVEEGQQVKMGQTIAILDNRDKLQANLAEVQRQVTVAKSRLAQVKAGAKQGEISARKATISRLQAELSGEINRQQAEIARLQAQLSGDATVQQATINRLEAELNGQKDSQQATVARIQAEERNALNEVQRYEALFKDGAISQQELQRRRLTAETSTQQLAESQATQRRSFATLLQQVNEAKANRNKTIAILQQQINESKANHKKIIATLQQQINEAKGEFRKTLEVRPIDVANAKAEVDSAIATVKRLQAELDLVYIRAPKTSQILRVQTRPGETVSNQGIVELGQTNQMYAVAEIYESDIGKIRVGQTATITSFTGVFDGQLQGTVERIGLKIAKKDILDSDPTTATDARVIEVKIRLDKKASQKVTNFTNLQVNVEINI